MFENVIENVRKLKPLVHSVTNYVTVNDCANILLACGASPIMADDAAEVEEITALCSGMVINIGTLNRRTVEAMILAGKRANELNHPVVLDPVGAGASALRGEAAMRLLKEIRFSVIRGNASEIKYLHGGSAGTQGVDAAKEDELNDNNEGNMMTLAKALSKKSGAIVIITGARDIVTDGDETFVISNGHVDMSKITGTGCMLSALICGFISANQGDMLTAASAAVCTMGLCGELAHAKTTVLDGGTGSLRVYLIDYISKIDTKTLKEGAKIERK